METERIRPKYRGPTYYTPYREGIKWYYLRSQRNDEPVIMKSFDSKEGVAGCKSLLSSSPALLCLFFFSVTPQSKYLRAYGEALMTCETPLDCAHAAFKLADAPPNARPRESIEVRAIVFTKE